MVQLNEEKIPKNPQNITTGAYITLRILDTVAFLLSLFLLSFVIFLLKNYLLKKTNKEEENTPGKNETAKTKTKNE